MAEYDHVLVRYGEINTKGSNRSQLERLLVSNIQRALKEWPEVKVSRISSRILVRLNGAPQEEILELLKHVFGVSSLSAVMVSSLNLDQITKTALELLEDKPAGIKFKVEVRRGNKRFEMNSPELARHLGGKILEHFPGLEVDVHHPEVVVHVDVRDQGVYLFADKIDGAKGFPVGMSGKVVGLLSGGIDSPVAVWNAMKRGLEVNLVHFHSFPFTSERAQRKVEELVETLAQWTGRLELHLASVTEIQSEIQKNCPEYLRTVLLRRMMFRIASSFASKHGALGLVTGDSVGQVASQTLEALHVVDQATDLTVIRPLVTEDKDDIIRQARRLNTYETSIQPYDDCCSLFAPKHPKTKPTLQEIIEAEEKLNVEALVQQSVDSMEKKIIRHQSGRLVGTSFGG